MQPVGWHIEVEFQEDDTRTEAAALLHGGLQVRVRGGDEPRVNLKVPLRSLILLKPTIIESDRDWEQEVRETRRRLESLR